MQPLPGMNPRTAACSRTLQAILQTMYCLLTLLIDNVLVIRCEAEL